MTIPFEKLKARLLANPKVKARPIRADKDHRAALAGIDLCWGAPEGTDEGDRLDVLPAMVEIYEAKR